MLPVYMHEIELSQLIAALSALAPARCLEWGSGGSTRALLAACPFVEAWVSIEHDPVWFDKVRAEVTDPRLSLHLVEPDVPPKKHATAEELQAWNIEAELDPALMRRYVELPASLGPFDFVLVDGRARRFCLPVGFGLLRSGGLCVLHDAQRTGYHDALLPLGRVTFLEPWGGGQLALVRKP